MFTSVTEIGRFWLGNVCVVFDNEGTEVPLPLWGGQGQVMHTRECVGLLGMACVHESLKVQGNLAVTLNQNGRLPFERLEKGEMRGRRINAKVVSGVLQNHGAQQNSPIPIFMSESGFVSFFFSIPD